MELLLQQQQNENVATFELLWFSSCYCSSSHRLQRLEKKYWCYFTETSRTAFSFFLRLSFILWLNYQNGQSIRHTHTHTHRTPRHMSQWTRACSRATLDCEIPVTQFSAWKRQGEKLEPVLDLYTHNYAEFRSLWQTSKLLKCCFTSTETVGLLGMRAKDGHLDFHTAPELCQTSEIRAVALYLLHSTLEWLAAFKLPEQAFSAQCEDFNGKGALK